MQRTTFMTVAEVAETLGISKSHAYKIVRIQDASIPTESESGLTTSCMRRF